MIMKMNPVPAPDTAVQIMAAVRVPPEEEVMARVNRWEAIPVAEIMTATAEAHVAPTAAAIMIMKVRLQDVTAAAATVITMKITDTETREDMAQEVPVVMAAVQVGPAVQVTEGDTHPVTEEAKATVAAEEAEPMADVAVMEEVLPVTEAREAMEAGPMIQTMMMMSATMVAVHRAVHNCADKEEAPEAMVRKVVTEEAMEMKDIHQDTAAAVITEAAVMAKAAAMADAEVSTAPVVPGILPTMAGEATAVVHLMVPAATVIGMKKNNW